MTATPDTAPLDLDQPVPFTLTPKALDFLDLTVISAAIIGGALSLESALREGPVPVLLGADVGYACGRCGAGWFGAPPDAAVCPDCRENR